MLKFIQSIWNIVSTVVRLVVSTITTAVNLLLKLPEVLDLITGSFAVLPNYALGIIGLIMSILVTYFIIRLIRG